MEIEESEESEEGMKRYNKNGTGANEFTIQCRFLLIIFTTNDAGICGKVFDDVRTIRGKKRKLSIRRKL